MEAGSLFDHFADLSDPRHLAKTSHCLRDIVAIAICAVISGADSWNEVADYGEAKLAWLKTFLELPFGIPSHDTFRRVFALLDPKRFESCFAKWTGAVFGSQNHEAIAIDGKTLRRSFDRSNDKSPIHMVSAWATDKGITLGQLKTDVKSN
ncbi:MAG: ISAs1 family transposase, partial [Pseudobdellovibrionaceae bacterium]|nr:ISAs1 family transposase [Pseudobdellovibrionaceae bacterium]